MPGTLEELVDGPKQGVYGWELDVGTYGAAVLGDGATLTTTDELIVSEVTDESATLSTTEAEGRYFAVIARPVGLVPPEAVGMHTPHSVDLADFTAALPEDLGVYFDSLDEVTVTDSGDGATADGGVFHWWDVHLSSETDTFTCENNFRAQCVGMVAVDDHVRDMETPRTVRFVLIEAQPELILFSQTQGLDRSEPDEAAAAEFVTALAEGLASAAD